MNRKIAQEVREEVIDILMQIPWISAETLNSVEETGIKIVSRSSGVAGRAIYSKKLVEINVRLADNEEQFRSTLFHELAHVIARAQFGVRGHGREWKMVMVALGRNPARCHTIDVAEKLPDRYITVICPWCEREFQFGRRQYGNWVRKNTRCKCSACKSKFDIADACTIDHRRALRAETTGSVVTRKMK